VRPRREPAANGLRPSGAVEPMITLKTTWEKISAWPRIEMRSANGPGSMIMNCAIFACAAPVVDDIVRRQVQRRADNCDHVPDHWPHPTYFNGRVTLARVLRKIGHCIVSFALRFPVHVLVPGERSSRKATLEVETLSDNAVLVGSRAGSLGRTQW
jgi:hypothetical protein